MAGGALGAVARYAIGLAIMNRYTGNFPVATFLINVTGSFLIGLILTAMPDTFMVAKAFWVTGVLGGYTTFSSFEWEALSSPRDIAAIYLVSSVFLGLTACWAGAGLARYLTR